jgi:predicted DCC family thiol-disulfide oxidoreductase YuxK
VTVPSPFVLFDGYCKLCDRTVHFLTRLDKNHALQFISLQSPAGQTYLDQYHLPKDKFDSFVLIENGRAYERSTAGLRVLKYLRFPWPLLGVLRVVPRPLRDWGYQLIAHNRYRWFGRAE